MAGHSPDLRNEYIAARTRPALRAGGPPAKVKPSSVVGWGVFEFSQCL